MFWTPSNSALIPPLRRQDRKCSPRFRTSRESHSPYRRMYRADMSIAYARHVAALHMHDVASGFLRISFVPKLESYRSPLEVPTRAQVFRSTSKITAVDHPNSSAPFMAVIGPSNRQRSSGTISP